MNYHVKILIDNKWQGPFYRNMNNSQQAAQDVAEQWADAANQSGTFRVTVEDEDPKSSRLVEYEVNVEMTPSSTASVTHRRHHV